MPPDSVNAPHVSVIIPAYYSQATISRCLQALAEQTLRDFETIVVDSTPNDETEVLVREAFPNVRFIHSETRLLPHAARNRGVEAARGSLFAFTDPDIYPRRNWIERLVAAYESHGAVVVGGIACFGSQLLHRGVHLCKFSKWLPYGGRRSVDCSPSGNMLIAREAFVRAGGFPGEKFLGDVSLSRALIAGGTQLLFEPTAVVEHHHVATIRSFLRERFARGVLFGYMRADWLANRAMIFAYLVATVLPLRLTRIAMLVATHAARGGHAHGWILSFPIALMGHAASLAGESVAYFRILLGQRDRFPPHTH